MSSKDQHTRERSDVKMLVAMVSIGLICALLIVLTFEKTKPIIAKNKAEALQEAIFKVLPGISTVKNYVLTAEGQLVSTSETGEEQTLFAGYNEKGDLVGVALSAAGMGYADVIRVLYGYNPAEQEIIGFYVLESKETPGLGDKIEKDDNFLANFKAMDVALNDQGEIAHPITTVKSGLKENAWEVDGITGATISSRAIGDILATSTAHWMPVLQQKIEVLTQEKEGDNE